MLTQRTQRAAAVPEGEQDPGGDWHCRLCEGCEVEVSVVAGETGLRTPPLSDLSLSETMIVNTERGRRHTHEREREGAILLLLCQDILFGCRS